MTAPILPSAALSHDAERWIFNPLVDRVLRLRRRDRLIWLREVTRGIEAFPGVAALNRRKLLRGIVMHDVVNRVVFRLHTRFPKLAVFAARAIPIAGPVGDISRVPASRPIILALMHFGPILFVYTIIARTFGGRKIYALHAGGELASASDAYLRRIGVTPLLNDERALRFLMKAMVDDPNCVLAFGYDYLGRRSRLHIDFLESEIGVSRGLAYLADATNAEVFPAWGDMDAMRPRAVVGAPMRIDRGFPDPATRQRDLMVRLFSALETRVRRLPHVWSEWRNAGIAEDSSPTL